MKIEKFIAFLLTLSSIFILPHPVHAQGGTSDQCIIIRGATWNPNCSGSSGSTRQGNSNSANRTQQIQNAIGAFGAAMEQSARQQALREQRQAEEDARRQQQEQARQQQERMRQQQIDQQVQAAVEQARQDPSLNPFGKEPPSTDSPPTGNSTSPPIDPSADLTGQACKWMVVRDEESCGSRSCFYSEGQTVALGSRAYRCESGRWAKLRDCNQSLNELRKNECQRDIVSIFGAPGTKEVPAQKIHQQD